MPCFATRGGGERESRQVFATGALTAPASVCGGASCGAAPGVQNCLWRWRRRRRSGRGRTGRKTAANDATARLIAGRSRVCGVGGVVFQGEANAAVLAQGAF